MKDPATDKGTGHAGWVRLSHWVLAASTVTLAVSGYFILMVHPRLYWGEVGNDLVPALLELPISKNHQHGGWEAAQPFFADAEGPVSASRNFPIFNQNSWGRSLHFLAAWLLVLPGAVYLWRGIADGHFRKHFLPRREELAPRHLLGDVVDHLRLRIPRASGGPQYGVLQKFAYSFVVFVAAPLMVLTGLAMSPAITAVFPFLLDLFGGFQSARTVHFFAFAALALFALVHVIMVIRSGFVRQMRAMTLGVGPAASQTQREEGSE
ncbi:MAG: cytochrome b/b6 domain-containing protein [Acidobacteriota bacterium]